MNRYDKLRFLFDGEEMDMTLDEVAFSYEIDEQAERSSKKPRPYTVWRSADGRETPVVLMDDDHIENSIRYMERRLDNDRSFRGARQSWIKALSAEKEARIKAGLWFGSKRKA